MKAFNCGNRSLQIGQEKCFYSPIITALGSGNKTQSVSGFHPVY